MSIPPNSPLQSIIVIPQRITRMRDDTDEAQRVSADLVVAVAARDRETVDRAASHRDQKVSEG